MYYYPSQNYKLKFLIPSSAVINVRDLRRTVLFAASEVRSIGHALNLRLVRRADTVQTEVVEGERRKPRMALDVSGTTRKHWQSVGGVLAQHLLHEIDGQRFLGTIPELFHQFAISLTPPIRHFTNSTFSCSQ